MSNSSENTQRLQDAAEQALTPAGDPATQNREVQVDDSHLTASYSNFCRATGTPEELIIDFGMNPQPVGTPTKPVAVTQRVTLNYYTAKRLLGALHMAVQRHEAVFGVIEIDVQKRVNQTGR